MAQVCSAPVLTVFQDPVPTSSSTKAPGEAGRSAAHAVTKTRSAILLREQLIPCMKDDDIREVPNAETLERQRRKDLRRALTFGIVMATIQMGILLYFMYC